MRDRYQKEQDLPLAERWLENYLFNTETSGFPPTAAYHTADGSDLPRLCCATAN